MVVDISEQKEQLKGVMRRIESPDEERRLVEVAKREKLMVFGAI